MGETQTMINGLAFALKHDHTQLDAVSNNRYNSTVHSVWFTVNQVDLGSTATFFDTQ